MPIARAGYHPDVKAAGFHISDEIHVVAPLGKILMNSPTKDRKESIYQTLSRFNRALGYYKNPIEESLREYSLVEPKVIKDSLYLTQSQRENLQNDNIENWLKKSVLITSSREMDQGYWLAKHSAVIRNDLNTLYYPETTVFPSATNLPYVVHTNFKGLPFSPQLQVGIEVPHDNLRKKEILSEFFEVDKK